MGSVLALDELLDQRLEDELDEIAGFLNAQHARLVGVTARLLANPGTWQVPGIHTIEQYLCWRTGISAAHAHQIATIARRGDELPVRRSSWHRGAGAQAAEPARQERGGRARHAGARSGDTRPGGARPAFRGRAG